MLDNLIVSYSCLKIFVDDETYKSIFDDENKEESIRLKSTIYMDNSTLYEINEFVNYIVNNQNENIENEDWFDALKRRFKL